MQCRTVFGARACTRALRKSQLRRARPCAFSDLRRRRASSHESCKRVHGQRPGWRAHAECSPPTIAENYMMQELAEYLKVDGRRVHVVERSGDRRSDFWSKLCALAPWLHV